MLAGTLGASCKFSPAVRLTADCQHLGCQMGTANNKAPPQARLRQNAELMIQQGIAPQTQGWAIGASALALLHQLASNQATAADALKLLHELQVHQVELDMQHEQMEEHRQELAQRADHYAGLYEFSPVAHFTVDSTGHIIEGNLNAARLLGALQSDLEGCSIDSLVAPDSGPALRALLEQANRSGLRCSCRAQASDGSGWLEVAAITSPRGHYCLVVATALTHASEPA